MPQNPRGVAVGQRVGKMMEEDMASQQQVQAEPSGEDITEQGKVVLDQMSQVLDQIIQSGAFPNITDQLTTASTALKDAIQSLGGGEGTEAPVTPEQGGGATSQEVTNV